MNDLRELVEKFRLHATELKQFGSTNEARLIAGLAENLYHLAIEVKRVDDILHIAVKHK